MIDGVALDVFRVECLRPAGNSPATDWTSSDPPFYEVYGEKLVAAGRYQKAIRYEEHMRPLAQAILEKVEREWCPKLKIFSACLSVLGVSAVNLPAKAINRRDTEDR